MGWVTNPTNPRLCWSKKISSSQLDSSTPVINTPWLINRAKSVGSAQLAVAQDSRPASAPILQPESRGPILARPKTQNQPSKPACKRNSWGWPNPRLDLTPSTWCGSSYCYHVSPCGATRLGQHDDDFSSFLSVFGSNFQF